MPWAAKGKTIIRADTGKVVGHSSSHKMAQASVRARYANSAESFAERGVKLTKKRKK